MPDSNRSRRARGPALPPRVGSGGGVRAARLPRPRAGRLPRGLRSSSPTAAVDPAAPPVTTPRPERHGSGCAYKAPPPCACLAPRTRVRGSAGLRVPLSPTQVGTPRAHRAAGSPRFGASPALSRPQHLSLCFPPAVAAAFVLGVRWGNRGQSSACSRPPARGGSCRGREPTPRRSGRHANGRHGGCGWAALAAWPGGRGLPRSKSCVQPVPRRVRGSAAASAAPTRSPGPARSVTLGREDKGSSEAH